jgi:phage baseplate assembly protein W
MADTFQGFRFPVAIDQARGELAKETDYEEYVKQLIRQVLLTSPGERVNRPDFGAGLRRMVFAPNDDATASLLQTTIFQALTRWLGDLISVDKIEAQAVDSELDVAVTYTIKARGTQTVLNLEVTS